MSGTYQDPYAPRFDPDGQDFPATYPNLLAKGVTGVSGFSPFELWAGESDIVTSQGTAAANIAQFQVLTMDSNGHFTPWLGFGGTEGTQTFTYSAVPANNDTLTVNGVSLTYVTDEANEGQLDVRSMQVADVTRATAAYINANQEAFGVTATATATTVVVTANEAGTAANATTTAESSTAITVGGATLAGGTATTSTGKAVAFAAQPAVAGGPVAVYVGGVPNHEALIWPTSCNSLDQRKLAFAGSNIVVGRLL